MTKLTLDIVSDVVCPWCYLGKKRIDETVQQFGADKLEITWRPFQLDPSVPKEGVNRREHLIAKFGSPDPFKDSLPALIEMGKQVGIHFNFDAIEMAPNTLAAHRVIRWALNAEAQNKVVEALFSAYFEKGLDIGDQEVLLTIAEEAGMDREVVEKLLSENADEDLVQREIDMARQMGVSGVPTFIANNQMAVSGAQEVSVLKNFLESAEARTA